MKEYGVNKNKNIVDNRFKYGIKKDLKSGLFLFTSCLAV